MGNTPGTQFGFMSLPRETRDEIYSYLLTSIYRIGSAPSLTRTDYSANKQLQPFTRYPLAREPRVSKLYPPAIQVPSDRTKILQVNSIIGAEAREVLYRYSTFVFVIGSISREPSALELEDIEAHKMRNIEVNVERWHDLLSAGKLLSFFAGNSIHPNRCVINLGYTMDLCHLSITMPYTVGHITMFKTVEVNIQDQDPYEPRDNTQGLEDHMKRQRLEAYKGLISTVSINLKSCALGYMKDGEYQMGYHPQNICRSKAIAQKGDLNGGNSGSTSSPGLGAKNDGSRVDFHSRKCLTQQAARGARSDQEELATETDWSESQASVDGNADGAMRQRRLCYDFGLE